jgi:exodeoxyribonuclease III
LKLATLNIQHGGGKRIAPIAEFLQDLKSDVLILTEYHLADKDLSKKLMEFGYQYQVAGSQQAKENSVLIASKESFSTLEASQRITSVKLKDFTLFGVYFPQGNEKLPVYEMLKSEIKEAGTTVLVLGDFNTGIHFMDEAGKTFTCVDSFKSLEDVGLVDSWRTRNPTTKEFSWYSSQGNGFRIDHAFCSKELDRRVSKVEYIHTPRELKFTDHSALVVEIF